MSDVIYQVDLQWFEVTYAAQVGVRRHVDAREAGRRNKFDPGDPTDEQDGWDMHIEGAAGELAAAKLLGVYWPGRINSYRFVDVGEIQVRTRRKPGYELLVRPDDPNGVRFYLVRGRTPTFYVVGWLFGHEAKRGEWMQTHGGRPPAYFVPDLALHPAEPALRWKTELTTMLHEIGDPELDAKVADYLRAQPGSLLAAHERVSVRLEEKRRGVVA